MFVCYKLSVKFTLLTCLNYFTVVRDVLTTEIKEHTKLCVIATARSKGSLHQSLTNSRGSHFFQSLLEIQPLNKVSCVIYFLSFMWS